MNLSLKIIMFCSLLVLSCRKPKETEAKVTELEMIGEMMDGLGSVCDIQSMPKIIDRGIDRTDFSKIVYQGLSVTMPTGFEISGTGADAIRIFSARSYIDFKRIADLDSLGPQDLARHQDLKYWDGVFAAKVPTKNELSMLGVTYAREKLDLLTVKSYFYCNYALIYRIEDKGYFMIDESTKFLTGMIWVADNSSPLWVSGEWHDSPEKLGFILSGVEMARK